MTWLTAARLLDALAGASLGLLTDVCGEHSLQGISSIPMQIQCVKSIHLNTFIGFYLIKSFSKQPVSLSLYFRDTVFSGFHMLAYSELYVINFFTITVMHIL